MSFDHLFEPGNIGQSRLRNRIIMPLFPTKYATESKVNPKMIAFYRIRARGGVALIVLDCPCLDYPRAYKGPNELRFDEEEYASGIRELIDAVHTEGAKAFMQLNYPRDRKFQEEVPGAKKNGNLWVTPLSNTMSLKDAEEIMAVMARGAKRAREIGYDGVEIQASYGDLIAQLLSPLLNKRTDELGGSVENRARFLTRLMPMVKTEAGRDFPVMVKLVCDEFVSGGLGVDEAKEIASRIEQAGADAIVANAGNKQTKFRTIPPFESPHGPLVELASQIKSAVSIPVIAIGKITKPDFADRILSHGKADFVAMARALVADPNLPRKAEDGRVDDIRGCAACLEDCADKGVPGIGRCCTMNPFVGHEHVWEVTPTDEKKKVLVVGGGPGGIQAATIAGQRGHDVELWERSQALGGQARLAHIAPFKGEMTEIVRYLKHTLNNSPVNTRLGVQADLSKVIAYAPDVVIVATGSHTKRLPIPGIDSDWIMDARELYEKKLPVGQKIVIVGGGDIGCETADWLAEPGRDVTVVEIQPQVLSRMKKIPKERLLSRLSEKGVTLLTETRITAVGENGMSLENKDGESFFMAPDTVIIAIDAESEDRMFHELKGKIKEVIAVGDAASPGNLGAALRSATEAALRL